MTDQYWSEAKEAVMVPVKSAKQVKYGRKKTYYKRRGKLSVPKYNWAKYDRHTFKESFVLDTLTAASPQGRAYRFQLTDLANVANYQNIYDQYMIWGIKIWAIPTQNSAVIENSANSTGYIPAVFTCVDYDDDTPLTFAQMMERSDMQCQQLDKMRTLRWVQPKVLQEVYRSALTTSYAPKSKQVLDIANADVPHYGFKLYMEPKISDNNGVRIMATMYFTLYNKR